MDNNDSMKSQQTGGLKLMTVFIAVLALHVVVIGGFTVYHLMSGGNTDADLATTDKNHKAIADGTMPDASPSDKSSSSTTASPETAAASTPTTTTEVDQAPSAPATSSPAATASATPAPISPAVSTPAAPSVAASTPTPAPAMTPTPAPALVPAPTLTLNAPKPLQLAPPAAVAESSQATGPIQPSLAPPPDMVPTPAPLTSLAAGPVHMPPASSSTTAAPKPEREHEHQQIYVVKITDSYKKIAKAHHVTVAQLKEANHIKGDTLHTGQKLIIPSEKKYVAENSQASTSALSSAPVLSESVAPMTTSLNSASSTTAASGLHHHLYTIEKGDTLVKIAHKFKTTPSAIMAENSIANPTKLTIGKKLKIPSKESRSAKVAEPAATAPEATVAPQPAPPAEAKEQYETPTPSGQLANFTP